MLVLNEVPNPVTGKTDMELNNEDLDLYMDTARSAFGDMLHDTERNQKYYRAIKSAIDKTHAMGKKAFVLDIGTGTGLLSMMAAKSGADSVVACEAFKPMARCAQEVVELNGFGESIKVIGKRSTELTVGENADLPARANILVTELFDTELIGEGALSIFKHARDNLLAPECIIVPTSATVYIQVVESPFAREWNRPKDVFDEDGKPMLEIPTNVQKCPGLCIVHDLQLSQLPANAFKSVIGPRPVFTFRWNQEIEFDRRELVHGYSVHNGVAHAVFMWWDLQMDTEGAVTLSCAPFWAHPSNEQKSNSKSTEIPWRDHWLQAIYHLPRELRVSQNDQLCLSCSHDEYSFWFDLVKANGDPPNVSKQTCECGFHDMTSWRRVGQLNDGRRNKRLISLLADRVDNSTTVLVANDSFYLGLAASKLGAKHVYYITPAYLNRFTTEFIRFNNLKNVTIVRDTTELKEVAEMKSIDLVISDVHYQANLLPWNGMRFGYLLEEIADLLTEDVGIFPEVASVMVVPVKFRDLHKIRVPVRTCEGFDMKPFDDLMKRCRLISDNSVEPQPLWEYPCVALNEPREILRLKMADISKQGTEELTGTVSINNSLHSVEECNGLALWVNWEIEETSSRSRVIMSSGPRREIEVGKTVEWDFYMQQAVCIFEPRTVSLSYQLKFDAQTGKIDFNITDE